MLYSKILCGLACVLLLASNIVSMSHWSERRGVADDLCYLRQAHLFQKSGIAGLRTDRDSETDGYFRRLVTEVGHPDWDSAEASVCHIMMMATGQRVIQYPPGPGFVLAMFPEGFQVIPLYAVSTLIVALISLAAIALASSRTAMIAATAFGCLSIYFMINPAKASYSMPPTMVICAIVGWLTAVLFQRADQGRRNTTIVFIGLLLGLSVNFRIANLLLSAGYFVWLVISCVIARNAKVVLRSLLFSVSYGIGMLPTLAANAINAGSPFRTTYGGGDVGPPDFSFSITGDYLKDIQGFLIVSAILWTIGIMFGHSSRRARRVIVVTAVNLAISLVFFLSHPVFTQYYLMPLAMLTLWTLLFSYLLTDTRHTPARIALQNI